MKPIRPISHRPRNSLVLVLLVVLAAAAGVARADEVIDQSKAFTPIGQSFTPTLTSLNFFDVFTKDFASMGATLEIEIFSGILQNPLGTSLPTVLPGDFIGPTDFTFASPVPLVPGNLYSAQVIVTSGDDWGVGSSGGPSSTYPGGDEILGGLPHSNNDLRFQEGIRTPEPCTLLLLGCGFVGVAGYTRRRPGSSR
jgi:hypothetical protein